MKAEQSGKTPEDKEAFGTAFIRIILDRHPITKDLKGFDRLVKFGKLMETDSFFSTADGAFDDITIELINAEVERKKAEIKN